MTPAWAVALFLMVRAWRMEVRHVTGALIVRGHLWTRRIPAATIESVSDFPAIRWRSGTSKRWTPLWMFWTTDGMLDTYKAHPSPRGATPSEGADGRPRAR